VLRGYSRGRWDEQKRRFDYGAIVFCVVVLCDIAPTSSELISELEQAAKTLIEPEIAVDPTPSPSDKPKVAKREIVIFSADWCEPCKQWKRCEQAKFEQAGYTFAYGNPDDVKRLPHFIVVDGEKTVEISGYMTLERLAAELAK
jgi:hypothetical protein